MGASTDDLSMNAVPPAENHSLGPCFQDAFASIQGVTPFDASIDLNPASYGTHGSTRPCHWKPQRTHTEQNIECRMVHCSWS